MYNPHILVFLGYVTCGHLCHSLTSMQEFCPKYFNIIKNDQIKRLTKDERAVEGCYFGGIMDQVVTATTDLTKLTPPIQIFDTETRKILTVIATNEPDTGTKRLLLVDRLINVSHFTGTNNYLSNIRVGGGSGRGVIRDDADVDVGLNQGDSFVVQPDRAGDEPGSVDQSQLSTIVEENETAENIGAQVEELRNLFGSASDNPTEEIASTHASQETNPREHPSKKRKALQKRGV